jgi:hypothetical protein
MSRRTEQREAIFDALRASDRAVTAQELHGELEGVGLATVYRNLQRLADAGDADTLRRHNGEVAFTTSHAGNADAWSRCATAGWTTGRARSRRAMASPRWSTTPSSWASAPAVPANSGDRPSV